MTTATKRQQRMTQQTRTRRPKAGPRRKEQDPRPTEAQARMLALIHENGSVEYRPQASRRAVAVVVLTTGQIERWRRPTLAELVRKGLGRGPEVGSGPVRLESLRTGRSAVRRVGGATGDRGAGGADGLNGADDKGDGREDVQGVSRADRPRGLPSGGGGRAGPGAAPPAAP